MDEELLPRNTSAPRGWHSRGYLPHFDAGSERSQFVTFRLADSLPEEVVRVWLAEVEAQPETKRKSELRNRIEAFLDRGHGECHLRNPQVGSLVQSALLHFDDDRYDLHAWVVMPNHVHVLFTPKPEVSLSRVVQSWKSYTSKEANKLLHRVGQFWMEEYFDRFIRDERHYFSTVEYIEANPVSAGLCERPDDWPFGSARWRTAAGSSHAMPLGTAGVPPALLPATEG
jgi:REP element-mobilizing transposase RayT